MEWEYLLLTAHRRGCIPPPGAGPSAKAGRLPRTRTRTRTGTRRQSTAGFTSGWASDHSLWKALLSTLAR